MKSTRRLLVAATAAAVIWIPAAATAQGNCVGETARFAHASFPGLAQSAPGAVGDWLRDVRENPDGFPWCAD